MKNDRMKPEEMLKEAKSYFDKLNLNAGLESLFGTKVVKEFIHSTYEKYEKQVKGLVDNMPKEVRKRGEDLLPEAIGREDDFFADVKNNLMCNMVRIIKMMEDFVPVDDDVSNIFAKGFTDEADGKMLEMVKYFAEGLANSLLHDFMMAVSVPAGYPPEVAAIIAMLGGEGAIAMNGEEMLEFLNNREKEDPDEEEED